MSRMISRKIIDKAAHEITGHTYSDLSVESKRFVLECILGDDWSTVLKTIAPPVLNYLWTTLKNSNIGKKTHRFL